MFFAYLVFIIPTKLGFKLELFLGFLIRLLLFSAVCMNCFGEAAYTKRTSNEESLEVLLYSFKTICF
jgi:hypothetical protein